MDAAAFEQVYEALQDFHSYFGPLFGRREARDLSRHYLQALLVQSGERRNTENLSEMVPASARAVQRFLTESLWDDDAVMGRLREYLGPRPSILRPCGCWMAATSPSRAGSRWELPGSTVADWARWPTAKRGCFWPMSARWAGPWWTSGCTCRRTGPPSDQERCMAAGVPEERRRYRSKTELALQMLQQALSRGHLRADWVAADDAFGMSPSFRDRLAALGVSYVLDVPAGFTVWPVEPEWTSPAYRGRGGPPKPKLVSGQKRTMMERSDDLPEAA